MVHLAKTTFYKLLETKVPKGDKMNDADYACIFMKSALKSNLQENSLNKPKRSTKT